MNTTKKLIFIFFTILSISCTKERETVSDKESMKVKVQEPTSVKSSESDIGMYAELSSNFIINHSKRWQLLASSQNYGSNYAVYAKFYTDKAESKVDSLKVTSADFMLLNYKNMVYIGLEDIVIKSLDGNLYVKIYVKALGKYHGLENSSDNEVLSSSNSDKILPKKDLNLWVKNDHILKSERILLPLHLITEDEASNLDDNEVFKKHYEFSKDYSRHGEKLTYAKSNNGELFDNEFFYKDGIYITVKEDYDSGTYEEGAKFTTEMLAPDNRCRDARFRILISN